MKYATFEHGGRERVGLVDTAAGRIHPLDVDGMIAILSSAHSAGEAIPDVPISAGITLYPGDVIATGTPKGVGVGCDPPRYLRPGDCVRIEIDGLGILVNRVGLNSY
jgi:hypothetical protein